MRWPGNRGSDGEMHLERVEPVDVDGLRKAGVSVEEIDGLTFGERIMQLRSTELAGQILSPRLRSEAFSNAEQLRVNVDRLLDLRIEIAP